MPIRLHCNELLAPCLTTNALYRTAEIGAPALLLKCVLIVYIWPEKGVVKLVIRTKDNYANYALYVGSQQVSDNRSLTAQIGCFFLLQFR